MFRSLLNTLPVLSGNFTIACKLNNISKKSNNSFESYIYEASIKPLDENIKIYKTISINLMNGKYSFDIKKYTNVIDIHKNVYKNNYTTFMDLDTTSPDNDRNKIYEFGCKRISYEMNKNEWSFYAPFYINNFKDIPDYFIIEIKKKDSNQVLKQIKVYIGRKKNDNKLYYYLKRHIEQIENNIPITWQYNNKEIIIHNAIDYSNGVIMSRVVTSNSQILYSNHVTINEFDSMLNNLYYYNGFILSEVIPISFEFTLSDFLDQSELKYYQMNNFDISGYYIKNEKKYPFYIFETNFHNLILSNKMYDSDENDIIIKEYNLYNKSGKNSLHESTNVLLRKDNTISKQYCKWVNYDNENYYINNNISYSSDFGKYGYFPVFKNLSESKLKLKVNFIDGKLNAWIPNKEYFDEGLDIYTKNVYSLNNECVVYNNMILNNISTWFEMWQDSDQLFLDFNKWATINKFNNSCFYKGIVYQNLPEDADYFGVFLKVYTNDISNSKMSNLTILNNVIDYKNKGSYELYKNEHAFINVNTFIQPITSKEEIIPGDTYYEYYREDQEWYIKYSDIKAYPVYIENGIQTSFEQYFGKGNSNVQIISSHEILDNLSFSNINNYYQNIMNDSDVTNDFSDTDYKQIFNELYYLDIYSGVKQPIITLLDNQTGDEFEEYKENNISKIFKKESFVYIPKKDQIYNILVSKVKQLDDSNIPDEIVDLLKFNYLIEPLSITVQNINTILQYINNTMYMFTNSNAVLFKDIKDYLLIYKFFYIDILVERNTYQLYYYILDNSITNSLVVDYFRKYEQKTKNGYKVYVDSYNLNNIISNINTEILNIEHKNDDIIDNDINIKTNEYYCKFIDLNHFKEYCRLLYSENSTEDSNVTLSQEEIFNTLYCKRTIIYNVSSIVNKISSLKDNIYSNGEEISTNIIDEILNNITYDVTLDEFLININNKTIHCELFYKKELIEFTPELRKILENIKPDNTNLTKLMSNYMYYYSFNNSYIYKHMFELNTVEYDYETIVDEKLLLSPIFESVYLNYDRGENFVETNKRFFNSLSENNLYSKYTPTMSMYVVTDNLDITNDRIIYKKINVNFAELEDFKTYTDKTTNKKYYYFLINEYLANNTVSYNLYNTLFDKINIDLINTKVYNQNVFLDIYPFVKNDIFLDISQQIKNWILYPTHVKLRNIYKSININNVNNSNLIENNQNQYIYLNRYFGNIMPCLIKVEDNIPDMYKRMFKIKNYNFINENNSNAYILHTCNIYKNQPIYYIDNYKKFIDNNEYLEFYPQENKHFMNNLLYHLPKYIELNVPSSITITYNDITQYEDVSDIEHSKIFEYFKTYIKHNFYNKIVNKDGKENIEILLFLFKLYSYTIEKNIIKYNIKLNNKLYSISYKLTLK